MSIQPNGSETIADRIIAEFRATTPEPTPEDWDALIAAHPDAAGELADAAMLDRSVHHLDESDVNARLDLDAYESDVSQAMNRLYEVPSTALCEAQSRITAVQGPKVRALARELGLGSAAAPLLSGILVGAIEVPRKVLDALAAQLGLAALVLTECFHRARAAATVPAFKAENGKPGMSMQPTPWRDAVKSLRLSEDETLRLLRLED